MRTEELIGAMAADTTRPMALQSLLPATLAFATALIGGFYLVTMGVRPDLGEALGHLNVVIKQVFPVLLALGGLTLVLQLSRPGAAPGPGIWLVAAGLGLVALSMAAEMLRVPVADWAVTAKGHSRGACLLSIPLISLPVGAVCLAVLRRGAPTRPGLCGAAAGLMSAGAGAAAYAFFCNDDSPLFFGLWYVAGIALVTLLGAVAGRRLLRW